MGISTPSGGGGAPTDAEYVTGSSNSELSNETVVSPASDILTADTFATTAAATPGFGSFTTVSSTTAGFVTAVLSPETDGSSTAVMAVDVDQTGSGSADYTAAEVRASFELPAGVATTSTVTVFVPAGGQYKIVNVSDPRGDNEILHVRHIALSP